MTLAQKYNVTICGFGLIGGSITLDLIHLKSRPRVVALDKPRVISLVTKDVRFPVLTERVLTKAAAKADVIILAAPPKANMELLTSLGAISSLENCLIVDVGSTKRGICALGKKLSLGKGTQFVGCHPMAGTEQSGFQNGVRGLFRNTPWFVNANVRLTKNNREKLDWLASSLGAQVVTISPEDHDRIVAVISHLPQLLSTLLAAQLSPDILRLSGPGLKSVLRLAGSPYALWANIIDENRDEIIDALAMYRDNLGRIISYLKKKQSLELVFNSAVRSYRCLS